MDLSKIFLKEQRKLLKIQKNYGCEITLLCNCLTGLLVFPEQKFYDEMQTIYLTDENYEKLKSGLIGKEQPCEVKEIFRRMRNAVSHCNIKFESETAYKNDTQIKYVLFYDDKNCKKRKIENFEYQLKIDITDLKDILMNFCNELLKSKEYEK